MRTPGILFLASLPLVAMAANPVMTGADPHAAVIDRKMWIYPTEPRGGGLFAAYSSLDLRTWQRSEPVLRLSEVPWVKEDGAPHHYAWAPAIAERDKKFYFYYSVGPQNPTPSRIGVAVGDNPAGPFKDSGKPLVVGGNGFEAIDPMVFIDPKTNTPYLYAGGSSGAKLRVWELNPDMVSIKSEIAVEQPENFTEGAFMHFRNGVYYLSYSHGRWNDSSYSVHYATAPSPTGPWTYRGPILKSDAKHQGPGHHSFVQDPRTNAWLIVYHRWESTTPNPPYKGGRKVAIERISYNFDNTIAPIKMTD